jgi:hypothetical protein
VAPSPYRWQHDQPSHVVPRAELVSQLEGHLRRGVAVKLVGGRGMGKSVLLRQVQARFAGESDTRAVIVPGPPDEATLVACIEDIATRLGLAPLARIAMDALMEAATAQGIERIVLLVDEADQYVLLGASGDLARSWFNRLEALRKGWMDRLSIVVAGGLGLLHLGHVLGSGLVSRAETCVAEPFGLAELRQLAEPFATHSRPLSDDVLAVLEALSGGNPALATYGLEQLWEEVRGEPVTALQTVFGEFPSRHGDFLRAMNDAVSHSGLVKAPRQILQIVRQRAGGVPQQVLREACMIDDPPVDVVQAVQLLRAAGLVGVSGSVHADPLQIRPIASIVNLPTQRASGPQLAERVNDDVARVLGQMHRFGRDFHGKRALLEEQVFSSLLAVGLSLLGWTAVDREAVQAAGYTDVRVRVTQAGAHGNVVIEIKLWPRNDYDDIQAQLDAYRVSDTVHAIAVMLGERTITDLWAEEYEQQCLAGATFERLPPPPDLVGYWRVNRPSPTTGDTRQTTHFLVQIPKRS